MSGLDYDARAALRALPKHTCPTIDGVIERVNAALAEIDSAIGANDDSAIVRRLESARGDLLDIESRMEIIRAANLSLRQAAEQYIEETSALRKELRRAMTVLMEAEAGSLEHFSRHPGSQPRSEQWQSCRICGVVAERIREVVHRPTCWFKNVAEQIDRLAALTEPVASDAREAPATPVPDGPDGERLREALSALVNACEDAFETPEEAADWARTGDMRGYLDTALAALRAPGPALAPQEREGEGG